MPADTFDADNAAAQMALPPEHHLREAVRKFTSTDLRRDGVEDTRVREAQIHLGIATVMLLQQISKQLGTANGGGAENGPRP